MGTITREFANNILTSGNYDASALSGTLHARYGWKLDKISETNVTTSTASVEFTDEQQVYLMEHIEQMLYYVEDWCAKAL